MDPSPPRTASERALGTAADELRPEIDELALRIHRAPELSGEERRAVAWCREVLERHGFDVRAVPGVETAFVAEPRGSAGGTTVDVLAEYDALPEVGHGCGHHLIAGAAVAAAILANDVFGPLPGRVRVLGCPAEETGQGKAALLSAGALDDTDFALQFHPDERTAIIAGSTGVVGLDAAFRGAPAHAAMAPWTGASALDGVLLTYQNLNALRQFVPDGVRIHGVVTDGGGAWNVVPPRAACRIAVRAPDPALLETVRERAVDCIRAAALATRTEVDVSEWLRMDPVRPHEALAAVVRRRLAESGDEPGVIVSPASTDFGNVSQRVPAVQFTVATWPAGTEFHTPAATAAGAAPAALDAMMAAARVIALAVADVLTDGPNA